MCSMFFSEYLHEKAEESRHNETVEYLIIVIGSIFFVGGSLETVVTVENPEWFLIIPYHLTPHPYSLFRPIFNIHRSRFTLFRNSPKHPLCKGERMVYEGNTESACNRRTKSKN